VDNIRTDLGEVGWGDVDWIGLAKDMNRRRALVNSVLNLRDPWNAGKLSNVLTSSGLLSSAQLRRLS
jgi:L-alanine-DL-glutamate epimerase-like enolase superfamily enzyme